MTTMPRSASTVFVSALAAVLVCAPTAPLAAEVFELVDPHFVGSECARWTATAGQVGQSDLTAKITDVCGRYRSGQLTGDQWLEAFDPIARATDAAIPCPNCFRILLPRRAPIPRGFAAYTMFLVPSAEWQVMPADLRQLRQKFDSFGDAVGDTKAAIWFVEDPRSSKLDVARSKSYCDRLKLDYNDGPYVVTSRARPDDIAAGDEVVVIRLSGVASERIIRILNILEQDLRTNVQLQKRKLLFEEIKQRVLTAAERNPEIVKGLIKLITP